MNKSITEKGLPIGGWLIFFSIGLFGLSISSFLGLYGMFDALQNYDFDYERSQNGLLAANFYSINYQFLISYMALLFVCSGVLHYFFWNKRREFPLVFIVFGIINFLLMIVTEMYINVYTYRFYSGTFGVALNNLIWFTYLLRSHRVQQTFIHGRKRFVKISEEEYEQLKKLTQ